MSNSEIYNAADTICAISTPAGSGAIALVRLSGEHALIVADKIWRGKSLAESKSHTAHLGNIVDPTTSEIIDQAVATIFRGPNSFTGEDTVEFALHGSRWIQQRVINILVAAGARPALPGEFTRRAFAAGKLDLAEAEAVADLIAADSKAAHRLAMSQLRGEYSSHLNKLRDELINLASLLELELDFSEEEVEFASRERLITLSTDLHRHLSNLAASYAAGKAIKDGFPIAIIGPTNAGKSSLLNALLGDDRAIVSDIHGTTRDIVEDTIEMGPYLVRFKDTAGLRDTDDVIEQLGIQRSRNAAATAGIVLYIADSSNPPEDTAIAAELSDIDPERVIRIYNKADISQLSRTDGLHISALTGAGLDTLRESIIERISELTGNRTDNDITVTNARHADALRKAADSSLAVVNALNANIPTDLVAQDLRETIHHLSSITGDITTPAILENIFKNFCIGK